jgi:Dictyostelium (slime mold) repeat/EGF-like domain
MRCRFSAQTLSMFVLALATAAVAAAAPAQKVNVCHLPPGNPSNFHTITISENALPAHLAHGDLPGSCAEYCDTLCSDGNPCTIDACDANEHCLLDHPPVNCDDSNPCTTDACDPASGCVYAPVVCDDADNCTVDACDPMTGTCVAPKVECPDGQSCDPDTGECVGGPCDPDPCVNGTCGEIQPCASEAACPPAPPGGDYFCTCDPGWAGVNCDIDIDECESNPCVHGECVDLINAYLCDCQPGWTGTNCEINIDECASNPCVNGQCTDLVNAYSCSCQPGWTGTNCDIPETPTYNCGDRNPCTPENAANGLFYFSAEAPSQFVQCSEFGQCYVMNCPPGLVWDQDAVTCVYP